MRILVALFFLAVVPAAAQRVEVPAKMQFAGMTLVIRDDARSEIQKDVDALTASPRHYQIKVQRARTYFPIIESIFREEGLHDDFKYLVLQESALIADAVSTSNAVGFWQFKDFTAAEMGLRVDKEIDERMNIVSSTRAAARYLKKNYQYFNNWLYALQAYQMGAGGVMRAVKNTEPLARRMEITGKTYWYVKKFLAHKIAYEGSVGGKPATPVVMFEHRGRSSLSRLAKDVKVDESALRELNKWARSGHIPDDRTYVVLLPVTNDGRAPVDVTTPTETVAVASERAMSPRIIGKINGVRTIEAVEGDNLRRLVARAGVDFKKFLKWNDLDKDDAVVPGQMYFLGKKRFKGSEDFHTFKAGESLWAVSQQYGLRLRRLKRYNGIGKDELPASGTILYLASRKPREVEHLARVEGAAEVEAGSDFAWTVTTEAPSSEALSPPPASSVVNSMPVVHAVEDTEDKASDLSQEPSVDLEIPADSGETLQGEEINEEVASAPSMEVVEEAAIEPLERIYAIPSNGQHVVAPGETLYGISRRYGLSVMDLVERNGLSLDAGIKPGQVIRLVEKPSTSTKDIVGRDDIEEGFYHEVKTSDTLYSIARRYNVTIKDIMDWNGKKDFSLSVGEKLKILSNR